MTFLRERAAVLDDNQFGLCLIGQGTEIIDVGGGEPMRVRYVVADAMDALAYDKYDEGRKDRAALLRHISGVIRSGGTPTKRVLTKAAKEIAEVRAQVVACAQERMAAR